MYIKKYDFNIHSVLYTLTMVYVINNYGVIWDNYACSHGNIALVINESVEIRAASRGEVGNELGELMQSVSVMADRIRMIIMNSGRQLNKMFDGNAVIETEEQKCIWERLRIGSLV